METVGRQAEEVEERCAPQLSHGCEELHGSLVTTQKGEAEQPKWSAEAAIAEEELSSHGEKAGCGRNSLMTNAWLRRGLSRTHHCRVDLIPFTNRVIGLADRSIRCEIRTVVRLLAPSGTMFS